MTTFEAEADAMFVAYLARRGATPEALARAHEDYFKQTARAFQHRDPSDIEILDWRAMLTTKGAAPISDSVVSYCSEKSGRKTVGLWGCAANAYTAVEARQSLTACRYQPFCSTRSPCLKTQRSGCSVGESRENFEISTESQRPPATW